jgi:hypothetical protein
MVAVIGTVEPSGPFERALARLLLAAYKRRLRVIVETVPSWVAEEILSASECITLTSPCRYELLSLCRKSR